jgi:hypothetical protein
VGLVEVRSLHRHHPANKLPGQDFELVEGSGHRDQGSQSGGGLELIGCFPNGRGNRLTGLPAVLPIRNPEIAENPLERLKFAQLLRVWLPRNGLSYSTTTL